MTTTPTASPELPDLDHLEALARAATPGPWAYQEDSDVYTHIVRPAQSPGNIVRHYAQDTSGVVEANARFTAGANPAAVLALIALARRAQPEVEAPQAADQLREKAMAAAQEWANAEFSHANNLSKGGPGAVDRCNSAESACRAAIEALATSAATLSPLCGAQHAESGKDAKPFKWPNGCDKTIPRALRYLANNPRPSGGEQPFNGAHLYQLADEMEAAARALAAQQAAAPGAILEILRDVHDTLESQADSDIDHFEDDEEEREGAPMQYAARKVMEVIEMLKAAAPAGSLINEGTSAPGTPEAPKGGAQLLAELLGAPSLYSQVYVAATVGQGWAGPAARDAADAAVQEYGDSPAGLVEDLQSILDEVLRVDGAAQLDGGQEGSAS